MATSNRSEFFELPDVDLGGDTVFGRPSNAESVAQDEEELRWAAIERLPSQQRSSTAVLWRNASSVGPGKEVTYTVDVRKMDKANRELVIKRAFNSTGQDNYKILKGIKDRLDRVGLELPKVEVRFEKLHITADVKIGSRALPTLVNYTRDAIEQLFSMIGLYSPKRHKLTILNNISGVVKSGRLTLLLGPPGAGKSTLLQALAGKLQNDLKKSGSITYNGHEFGEFYVQRASSYISQIDSHIPEMTVRETLDFAAKCQGSSESYAAYVKELPRLEKENNIRPRPEIDAYMKASTVPGKSHSVSTEHYLKVLGLDVCADTLVGNDMLRGVSGGQKKRVTTGEMVVGPRKTLFMDEISTGLDSSTTFQIVKCARNYVHLMDGTVFMSLLQPAPETFHLFDDLILLSEGYIVYQGPRSEVLAFFESLGFRIPPRKNVADFLQEVTSLKDQAQYWGDPSKPYVYVPVSKIAEEFKKSRHGRDIAVHLSTPYDRSLNKSTALPTTKYAVSKRGLFRACLDREILLMDRNRFLYIFKTCQVAFLAFVACTTFPRTRLHPRDERNGNLYLGCLFFGLVHMMFNGMSELPLMIFRLPVFYKQRDSLFHPAWAWSLSGFVIRLPYSVVEAIVWSCVVYYSVGFAPSAGRFFASMLLLFAVHQMAMGLFRTVAAVARDMIIANTIGSSVIFIVLLMGGYVLPKHMIHPWWIWAYWISPLAYAQNAMSVNEFLADRWTEQPIGDTNLGVKILKDQSLPQESWWYWLGIGVLLAYALLFNALLTLALTYLNPIQKPQSTITTGDDQQQSAAAQNNGGNANRGMTLPFTPYTITFHNVNYFVDMPKEMRSQVPETRLQLLSSVSGVFSPGVLTALMGSSGAGKTTLMDVLAGRKTGGYIEGDIKISGYPKEQKTFARISGYVEQNDIHSIQLTVQESLRFSSFLRLPKEVDSKKREEFVEEVMKLVELDSLRNALVGLPGTSGLSTEQRKRLTIAVELVANPSIIFMDEPTSGLDARAAAIVMRTVRNTVDTGRTVVCTIHQPSIEIFEAFDELLLLKRGGRTIYGGKLGRESRIMIDYFQGISGVPPISEGYNPATWMLEISTPAMEQKSNQDFAEIYKNSQQFRNVEESIERLSVPPPNTEPLKFNTTYAKDSLSQFRICMWKQHIVYWRSPLYNVVRLFFTTVCAFIIGTMFWAAGDKRATTQNLFILMGALYTASSFLGINNASSVQPVVSIERTVFYREKAAGMYSPFPYAFAQGIIEIPYILVQTIIFSVMTYFMVHFERTAGKFFLYLLFSFLTFTYYTFFGIMIVGLTPNQQVASVVASAFFSLWNILSGFIVPKPNIPGWWIWFYYICPQSWTLQGIIASQLGDVETRVVGPDFDGTVKQFIKERFGYDQDMVGASVGVVIGFSLLFFLVFAISAKILNFQRR